MSTSSAETGDIRHEVTMLASRIEAVERRLACNGAGAAAAFDLANVMTDVRDITQQLFPGKFEFTSEFDPEYPLDRYVVVNVEATGNPHEIVDRSCRWHERIRQLSADLSDYLRLFIVPR
jgi:hypothetical protein